jgi:proprotein convertase subtilisin/kexin type 5
MLQDGSCLNIPSIPCAGKPYYFITNGTCTASCGPGFFVDSNSICQLCPMGCSVCSSSSSCLTCLNGFTLNTTAQACVCQSNFFTYSSNCNPICLQYCSGTCPDGSFGNTTSKICVACGFGCKLCTSLTTCTLCESQYQNNNGTCGCSSGYVLLSNGTCMLNPIALDPCYFNPYIWITNGSCTNNCGKGFYLDSTTMFCRLCGDGCSNCTGPTVCTVCYTGYVFSQASQTCVCAPNYYSYNNSCTNQCPLGLFGNAIAQQCQNCGFGCQTCVTNLTCTACFQPPYKLNATNQCMCLDGTYLFNSQCLFVCPVGYYMNNVNNTCNQCIQGCAKCSSLLSCLSCSDPSQVVQQGVCSSTCPETFYKDTL